VAIKAIIPTVLAVRPPDKWGEGHFGAKRGYGSHRGQDYLCLAESQILSPVEGKIIKHGHAYEDDLSFRYVRVETKSGEIHDFFYVESILPIGREIREGTVIGYSQDLTERYPGIGNHIHYQIKVNGIYINPETYT